MRIHVFEFIGGGGLAGAAIPEALAREGDLMTRALLADLLELPGVSVSYSRDARLTDLAAMDDGRLRPVQVCWRAPDLDPQEAFVREIAAADAVWPIAPETGGELERAARAVIRGGRILVGARPGAIAVAASKHATSQRLRQAQVPAVPTHRPQDGSGAQRVRGAWVVKPDDGAGCVQTRVFADQQAAMASLESLGSGFVAQPWIGGDPMSLSVVAGAGGVEVLSVNRQRLDLLEGVLQLSAVQVNAAAVTASLNALAGRVARAIDGLTGYFGIDFVAGADGPVIIEVNPRLTTSYAGLRPALGINAARCVLAAMDVGPAIAGLEPDRRAPPGRMVTLDLTDAAHG